VMLPSHVLLSNSVKNWRGMTESGARRLKHTVHFDAESVRFPEHALIARLHADARRPLALLSGQEACGVTNLGLYRRYLGAYFRRHAHVRHDLSIIIRQIQSEEPVVALEIYLYIDTTEWAAYERIQSDMLDHAYGVVPLFGLRCWRPMVAVSNGMIDDGAKRAEEVRRR
jgi:miniconductance mechanosensitive channel